MGAMSELHFELHGLMGEAREYRDAGDWSDGDCPDCQGEGYCAGPTGGATFSSAQGQWYPEEGTWQCPTCSGTGVAPACPQCFGPLTEMQHEHGPYCGACKLHLTEMLAFHADREAVQS